MTQNHASLRLFWVLLAVAVGVSCTTSLAVARTITVGSSGCNYTSIQQAINASRSGDTVLVRPGTYYEFLVLRSGISVVADSSGHVIVYSTFAPVVSAKDVGSSKVSGFVLEYAGAWNHNAVWIIDSSVEISNNEIRGGTYSGVHVDGSANPVIEGNTITGSTGNGVYLAANSRATVRRNEIAAHGASGIHVRDNAEPEISGNVIHDNTENGILCCVDSAGRIIENEISGNGRKGIYVLENAAPFIDANTIFDNAQEGIGVVRTSKVTVSNNDIHDNGWAGVFAGETAQLLLHGNTIYRNHEAVCIADEADAAITENVLYGNRDSGIFARNSPSVFIEANTIYDNTESGIYVTGSVAGGIWDNQVFGNQQRGIQVAGTARPNIADNAIHSNGREGISVARDSRLREGESRAEISGNDIYDHPHAGIFLGRQSEVLIRQNTIHGNFEGILVSDEVDVDVESNSICENRDVGVEIRENAVGIFFGNTIRGNEKCGIWAWGAASGEIRDNQINENSEKGIYLTETADLLVQGNELSGNAHEGISIVGSIQRTALDNTITGNGFAGIFVGETASAILTGNVLTENLHEGICVAGESTATVHGNSVSSNVYVGIRTQDSAVGIIEDNTVSDNAEHGIFAIGTSSGEIRGNTIRGNTLDGVSIQDGASFVLAANMISGNGQSSVTMRGSTSPEIVAATCSEELWIGCSSPCISVTYQDVDGDVCTARVEVLEGVLDGFTADLAPSPDGDQVTGVVDVESSIPIVIAEPGHYRLQITLVDEAGLESSAHEVRFEALLPHAPDVVAVEVPQLIQLPADVLASAQFEDLDGDLSRAKLEVLSGSLDDFSLDLTQPPYAGQVVDQAEGEFSFEIVPPEAGSYRIQLTLVDATGLESEPFEFSFEAYTPTAPVVDRMTFPTSLGVDDNQNGLVRFEDAEGDIVEARFDVIEGDPSTIEIDPGFRFDPEVEGETDGAFRFTVRVSQAQTVTLSLTLVDAAGLESEPYEFTFDAR